MATIEKLKRINHLGNVQATVLDRTTPLLDAGIMIPGRISRL